MIADTDTDNIAHMENKTERFELLMEPSTKRKLKRLAEKAKCSPAEVLRRLVKAA